MYSRTVISQNIPSNRIVNQLPKPFSADATPYKITDFHPQVKAACNNIRTGIMGLRIAKAVLVGDVSSDKTSLVNRFCHAEFEKDYKATIGVDFEVEKFSILSCPFTLQIWDTAGQERFKCIAASYYRGANVVIVLFDLSDESTIANLVRWMDDACENADQPLKFIVGNKKDLVSPAAYSQIESRVKMIANNLGAEYWAVSSKTGNLEPRLHVRVLFTLSNEATIIAVCAGLFYYMTSGENVKEFFFRVVALTFEQAIFCEVDTALIPKARKLETIKVEQKDLYEPRRRKMDLTRCCNH